MYKIVWITNTPLAAVKQKLNLGLFGTGTWMDNLLTGLLKSKAYEFYIISPYPIENFSFVEEGITFYIIHSNLSIYNSTEKEFLYQIKKIIFNIKPDLIHIHGSERRSGLLCEEGEIINVPIIISLQGLTSQISKVVIKRIFKAYHIVLKSDESFYYKMKDLYFQTKYVINMFRSGLRERRILKINKYFFGRTDFDKSTLMKFNSKARYFPEPRILREPFYHDKWELNKADRNSILLLNIRGPAKSAETAIRALILLNSKYPDIELRVGGIDEKGYYGQYLMKFARRNNLSSKVKLLGYLSDYETIRWLKKSHVFCLTSLIENSPNTLAEAQMIGLPCVAHITGGVASYVDDNSALNYFNNNNADLAKKIEIVFSDDEFAVSLGQKAYEVSHRRHDIEKSIAMVGSAYQTILEQNTQHE